MMMYDWVIGILLVHQLATTSAETNPRRWPCPGPIPETICGPTFFVIGAFKGGTTSIYKYIEYHPDVQYRTSEEATNLNPAQLKETGFFNYFNRSGQLVLNSSLPIAGHRRVAPLVLSRRRPRSSTVREYLTTYFPERLNTMAYPIPDNLASTVTTAGYITGEASPGYLTSPNAAQQLHNNFPHARLILSVRAPADRVYSRVHHLLQLSCGKNPPSHPHLVSLKPTPNPDLSPETPMFNYSWATTCHNLTTTTNHLLHTLLRHTWPLVELCLQDHGIQPSSMLTWTVDRISSFEECCQRQRHVQLSAARRQWNHFQQGHNELPAALVQDQTNAAGLWRQLLRLNLWANNLYQLFIAMWLSYFKREQLLVVHAGSLYRDTVATLQAITRHLHLIDYPWHSIAHLKFNVQVETPSATNNGIGVIQQQKAIPPVDAVWHELRGQITDYFQPWDEQLFRFTGERWW
jgi:hypothetical protein